MVGRAAPIDPRLAGAMTAQFEPWRAALRGGAARVGWKLGMGDGERIGDEVAIGHLTSASLLDPGAGYTAGSAVDLRADAEVALQLGRPVAPDADAVAARRAIAGYGVALEIVDLGGPDDPVSVVATNVFHRAVAFGPFRSTLPAEELDGRLVVNGRVQASGVATSDLAERVCAAARLLGAMGEQLQPGDRIITGSVVQVPIKVGDQVVAEMGALGKVQLSIVE